MYGVSILLSLILIILLIISMFIFVDNIKSIHKSLEKISEYQTKINNNIVSIETSLEKDSLILERNMNAKLDINKTNSNKSTNFDVSKDNYENSLTTKYCELSDEELLKLIKSKQKIFTQEIAIKENNEAVNLNIKIKGK